MTRTPRARAMAAIGLIGALAACQPVNPNWANQFAMQAGAPSPDAVQIRDAQTARFPGQDETALLREATQTLQDLGFTIEESAPQVGVLAGSKDRDATETGQVVGQVALTVGLALLGVRYNPVWDKDQIIRVTLTTRPLPAQREIQMRVSFERIVINTQNVARAEPLTSAEFNQGFFEKIRAGRALGGAAQ